MSEEVKKEITETKPAVSVEDLNKLYKSIKSDNEDLKKDNKELKSQLKEIKKGLPELKKNNDAFKEDQATPSVKKTETPTTTINEVKKDSKTKIDTTKITNGVYTGTGE